MSFERGPSPENTEMSKSESEIEEERIADEKAKAPETPAPEVPQTQQEAATLNPEHQKSPEQEISEKINASLAECLAFAQTLTDKDDIQIIFKEYLTGSELDFKALKLKELTLDNKRIMEERIDRVSAFAKLSVSVSRNFNEFEQVRNKFGKGSKEEQPAKKTYEDALEQYRVVEAMLAASDIEIIKFNDPNLEDPNNLSQVAFELNTATKYTRSLESIPYSKREIAEIRSRNESKKTS